MNSKQIWFSNITDTHTADKEGIGALRTDPQGKVYRYVYNNTGTLQTVGNVVYHGTLASNFITTKTAMGFNSTFAEEIVQFGQASKGTVINTMAGVVISAIPIAGYGWIQVYGYNLNIFQEGTAAISVGDNLKGVSGQYYAVTGSAATAAPLHHKFIIAFLAYSTGAAALKPGFIECL